MESIESEYSIRIKDRFEAHLDHDVRRIMATLRGVKVAWQAGSLAILANIHRIADSAVEPRTHDVLHTAVRHVNS